MNQPCRIGRIDTGDWVGSAWNTAPEWTPYAQAIADHYPTQVPWFWSTNVSVSPAISPLVQLMRPYQHDVLILGAHVLGPSVGEADQAQGEFLYLNVIHKQTGIPWATPNKLGSFPVFAIAGGSIGGTGSAGNQLYPMPVMRLPEAFFLPRNTQLKLEWSFLGSGGSLVNFTFTFLGVQLPNLTPGFRAPKTITMPNGEQIEVGSRLPWFSTVPMGEYQSRAINDFELNPGVQIAQFYPPQDCAVEIHGAYSSFTERVGYDTQLTGLKLTDMGAQKSWTPDPAPMTAVYGGEQQINPAMPFTKPYLLRSGHRLQVLMQNNNTANVLERGTLTLCGVRRCQY